MTVASVADPRLALYRCVADDRALKSLGLFVAEGRFVVARLLELPAVRTDSVLITQAAHGMIAPIVAALPVARRPPVFVVSQDEMDALGGFNFHRGCLALAERPPIRMWDEVLGSAAPVAPRLRSGQAPDAPVAPIVILERVGNPDNVGSIFRNAAAFGATVLIGPDCADPFYRKTMRTSMASVLTVPFGCAEPWPDALRDLRARGSAIVALTPREDAEPMDRVAASLRGRTVALLAGAEGDGLSQQAFAAADVHARIPHLPAVDSLNVATAVAIALYACRP